jgi:hypothetical protein
MTNKIIVHGGNAHLDDFVACAEALVARLWCWDYSGETVEKVAAETIIERRDPTPEELADPEVIVLDVGGILNDSTACYDHHQLPRGTRECAMTLFAKSVVVPCGEIGVLEDTLYAAMCRLYPWYETRAAVDSCGPFAVAKEKGVEWGVVASFLGPFEDIVLNAFIDAAPEERAKIVLPFARDILAKLDAERKVLDSVERWTTEQGVDVIDFTKADPADVDVVSDAILASTPNGVAVFRDKRGSGYAILRIKDDPRIDLSKAGGMPCIAFAHANGFYATTREPTNRATMADILGTASSVQ